ncbi:MAG TPA: O-methyltransferase [Thermomicrobiales bacterium]|nr:O-methyltransferase [Thermomicrobiales bacterium]
MSQEQWTAVDRHFSHILHTGDVVLDAALAASDAAGLPQINVTSSQGKLLMLMARMIGANRILEIGTLGGYSTIWLGRGVAGDGRIVTLELVQKHADVARRNLERAGLDAITEIRVGKATDSLHQLIAEGTEPFDLVFIDADKASLPDYLEGSLRLSRPGTVIIADNVVRSGKVANPDTTDEDVRGVQRYLELVGADPRLESTAIQTVGAKGYDGFAISFVVG